MVLTVPSQVRILSLIGQSWYDYVSSIFLITVFDKLIPVYFGNDRCQGGTVEMGSFVMSQSLSKKCQNDLLTSFELTSQC